MAPVRVWQFLEATRKWSLACDLDKHSGCGVNAVAWAPNMGRSYHLIATAGQDPRQQLKVGLTIVVLEVFQFSRGLF